MNPAFPVVFRQAASVKSELPLAKARKWLTEKSMLPFRHCCSFSLKKKKFSPVRILTICRNHSCLAELV